MTRNRCDLELKCWYRLILLAIRSAFEVTSAAPKQHQKGKKVRGKWLYWRRRYTWGYNFWPYDICIFCFWMNKKFKTIEDQTNFYKHTFFFKVCQNSRTSYLKFSKHLVETNFSNGSHEYQRKRSKPWIVEVWTSEISAWMWSTRSRT